jgi:hypothetical protein
MPGLPKIHRDYRPRDAFQLMVLEPIERMTDALRRGDAFTAQSLEDMMALDRRLQAFRTALHERTALLEEDE